MKNQNYGLTAYIFLSIVLSLLINTAYCAYVKYTISKKDDVICINFNDGLEITADKKPVLVNLETESDEE